MVASAPPRSLTFVGQIKAPRAVWIMVPSGAPTEETVQAVAALLHPGDTVIDGGNTRFTTMFDGLRASRRRNFTMSMPEPAGASGGLKIGYCLMVGGDEATSETTRADLQHPGVRRWLGSRRRSRRWALRKMVHTGIEYSMMQGYAEGFERWRKAITSSTLQRSQISGCDGSVVRSWLLELASGALKEDPRLEQLKVYGQDSGEGRWMIAYAIEKDVPVPTLATALFTRFRSRQSESFAEKMLAALRNAFGGHAVRR